MVVISPCDAIEARKAIIACAKTKEPTYIRLARNSTAVITTNDSPFEIELEYGDSNPKEIIGTFLFTIPAGKGVREFAIRVSSQYNWYSMNDYIALSTEHVEDITINKLQLLKGE